MSSPSSSDHKPSLISDSENINEQYFKKGRFPELIDIDKNLNDEVYQI